MESGLLVPAALFGNTLSFPSLSNYSCFRISEANESMNPLLLGIDHIQLAAPAGCDEAAREFYGSVLGLKGLPKPEKLRARGGMLVPMWRAANPHRSGVGLPA